MEALKFIAFSVIAILCTLLIDVAIMRVARAVEDLTAAINNMNKR